MTKSNGFNMLDVKKKNRSAILHLIHQNRSMSRKEMCITSRTDPGSYYFNHN